jgi:hypothetical protein
LAERNDIQRRLRRAKDSERRFGKWLLLHNGPDPRYQLGGGVVTTTGRVGHITGLQFDILSLDYTGENKNEKVPATWWNYWTKVFAKSIEEGKHPCIRIEPTNDAARTVLGRKVPNLHLISEERHAELLDIERSVREGQVPVLVAAPVPQAPQLARMAAGPVRSYSKEDQLGRMPKKGRVK